MINKIARFEIHTLKLENYPLHRASICGVQADALKKRELINMCSNFLIISYDFLQNYCLSITQLIHTRKGNQ